MDTVLQTNIFFYITSGAVILVTVFIIVILYYIIGILRDVKNVADKLKAGSDIVAEDLSVLRKNIKKDGVRARHFIHFFLQSKGRTKKDKK